MLILNRADLLDLLPPLRLVEAVESGVTALQADEVAVPDRGHLHWQGTTLLTMPAASKTLLGIKSVAVAPANAGRNLPVTNGAMLLLNAVTGELLALLNAAALTCQRTGAVGAMGIKYLTPADVGSVGIIGTGVQGLWQALYTCAVRPIRTIYYVAHSDRSAERFDGELSARIPKVQRVRCSDARALLDCTSLVITATTADSPVLPDDRSLVTDKHFVSIGSFRPNQQELPLSVYAAAGCLAIDSPAARREVGDVLRPLQAGILREQDVFHIGEVVTGRRQVDVRRTTVFKSVGAALYDLYVAEALYDRALAAGIGTRIDF